MEREGQVQGPHGVVVTSRERGGRRGRGKVRADGGVVLGQYACSLTLRQYTCSRGWDKERMSTLCAGPGGDAAGKAPTTAPAAWSLVYGRSDSTVGSLLCR